MMSDCVEYVVIDLAVIKASVVKMPPNEMPTTAPRSSQTCRLTPYGTTEHW